MKLTEEQLSYLKSLESKKKRRKFMLDCLVESVIGESGKIDQDIYQKVKISEAIHRGFRKGVKFKSVEPNINNESIITFGKMTEDFLFFGLDMFNSRGWILKNGKWAEIIDDKTSKLSDFPSTQINEHVKVFHTSTTAPRTFEGFPHNYKIQDEAPKIDSKTLNEMWDSAMPKKKDKLLKFDILKETPNYDSDLYKELCVYFYKIWSIRLTFVDAQFLDGIFLKYHESANSEKKYTEEDMRKAFNESRYLKMEWIGKDPINDIEDYKKVAKYVNTFSGRANLGKAEMISKDASLLIFSLRNWYSQLQQLSPVFYSNLGDAKQWKNVKSLSDLKNIKPTIAQKMAVKSFMTSVIAITSFKAAFMAWANSMSDDDEEKWTIETDSRSSDFGKLRKGNKTFDLWHGLNGLLVFYSRLFTQETKSTKSGEIKPLGKGFGTPNSFELAARYGSNKLAPSAGYVARLAQTHEEVDPSTGEKYRVDPFGNVYGEKEMKDLFVPIYWSAINEIRKEDPDVYETFLASIGILGMSVGTDPKGEKFKDIIGGQESGNRPSRPSAPKRPSRP